MTHPRGLARQGIATVLPLVILLLIAPNPPAWADAKSELRFQQGVAAFGAREFGAAREAFESFLTRYPDDAIALRYLGLISRHEDNDQEAIDYFKRALSIAPTDVLTYLALAETLLKAERNVPAQESLKVALGLAPQDAHIHLYLGIAEYRLRNLTQAIEHFERAAALDPTMEREARYYTGLTQAILGNLYSAAQAFTDVAEGSPAHPLGRSARNLREAMEPTTPEQRWTVSTTAGVEFDTNPTATPDIDNPDIEGLKPDSDFAGSFGVRGLVDVYRGEGITVRGGYDGFLLKHVDQDTVDEQTHVARGAVFYDIRNVRTSLRYNGSFTLLDFTDAFRSTHVVEPAVSVRVGRWGITRVFYQLHRFDYYDDPEDEENDLDGWQHSAGVNHTFTPRAYLTHIRTGFQWKDRKADGGEYDHTGLSVDLGAGALLPWNDIEVSGLYRFSHLLYKNASLYPEDYPDELTGDHIKRKENAHEITLNVNIPLWSRLSLDVAGAFVFRDSDMDFFAYDRQVVGTYLTWNFGGKPRPKRRDLADEEQVPREDEGRFPGE